MSFEVLLNELSNLHDRDGNLIGDQSFRKSQFAQPERPQGATARIPRSVGHGAFDAISQDFQRMGKNLRAESARNAHRAESERQQFIKALPMRLSEFSAKLRQATISGELSAEQAFLLETQRNRLAQTFANAGLI